MICTLPVFLFPFYILNVKGVFIIFEVRISSNIHSFFFEYLSGFEFGVLDPSQKWLVTCGISFLSFLGQNVGPNIPVFLWILWIARKYNSNKPIIMSDWLKLYFLQRKTLTSGGILSPILICIFNFLLYFLCRVWSNIVPVAWGAYD